MSGAFRLVWADVWADTVNGDPMLLWDPRTAGR